MRIEEFPDGRVIDYENIQRIRRRWIQEHMKDRSSEFTRSKSLRLFCGTWNVNGKKSEDSLEEWILKSDRPAEMYAIGFQEIVDLNAMNVALDSGKSQQRSLYWQDKIAECLQSTGFKYTKLMDKSMVGLLIIVFVKDTIYSHISDVRASSLGVGLMGVMGNKGGVAIRFNLFDSSVCFVCTHLAAHRENVVGRNSDFKNILHRLQFSNDTLMKDDDVSPSTDSDYPFNTSSESRLMDHEVIFWLGDLNYRIDESLKKEEVFELIEKNDIEKLKQNDQLNIERAAGRVFQHFEEANITFYPTYKYQPGTDIYDTRPEKKLRAPAYCDRILWKVTNSPNSVQSLNYGVSKLNCSDHKPVYSNLDVTVREIINDKQKKIYTELVHRLDSTKKDEQVSVEVVGNPIVFKDIKYEVPTIKELEIKNTGSTLVYWHFIPKLEEINLSKRWISIDMKSGLLLPGENIRVKISLVIDKKTAQIINQSEDLLDDLLVLRIENSFDHHIVVNINYLRSCYGVSLEELVYTTAPIRSTTINDFHQLVSSTPALVPKMSIPKEIWRLVDCLWSSDAIREKDLFSMDADPVELAEVREALDTSTAFPSCTPHAIANALTSLLEALPYSLLPSKLYPTSELDPTMISQFTRNFLTSLGPINYTVFTYLISFFREVLAQSDFNRSTPSKLAEVCINCMTPSAIDPDLPSEERERRSIRQRLLLPVIQYLLTERSF